MNSFGNSWRLIILMSLLVNSITLVNVFYIVSVCRLRILTVMHRWSVGFIVNGALQSSWWWWWWWHFLDIDSCSCYVMLRPLVTKKNRSVKAKVMELQEHVGSLYFDGIMSSYVTLIWRVGYSGSRRAVNSLCSAPWSSYCHGWTV